MVRIVKYGLLEAFICLAMALVNLPAVTSAEDKAPADAPQRINIRAEMVPMRDDVVLSTELFLPSGRGPFPAIIIRNPYSAELSPYPRDIARELAESGYAVVVQDCRGTGRSDGKWDPYIHEGRDGIDAHQWVLKQSWCNGKIATFGDSYLGYTQWLSLQKSATI